MKAGDWDPKQSPRGVDIPRSLGCASCGDVAVEASKVRAENEHLRALLQRCIDNWRPEFVEEIETALEKDL